AVDLAAVARLCQHLTGWGEQHCADRHVSTLACFPRLRQRQTHRFLVGAHRSSLPGATSDSYTVPMRLHVADHPLIAHKLTVLRDVNTPSPVFRQLTEELVTLLAYEATREIRTEEVDIETPVAHTKGVAIAEPQIGRASCRERAQ